MPSFVRPLAPTLRYWQKMSNAMNGNSGLFPIPQCCFLALFFAWDERGIVRVRVNRLAPRKGQPPVLERRTAVPLAEVD